MSKERVLEILRAMYDDALHSPRNPSITWTRAEETHIWASLYESANDAECPERVLEIIHALEMDARGRVRDLAIRWTPAEKADVIRFGILFVAKGGI